MGEQPTINPEARHWNPKFRKRKRWQGATWTPPSMSADKEDGVYCKACRKTHGYKTMGFGYEKGTSGRWKILWSCRITHNVIKEMEL
jgi:hypothetical protein